jgi:hypothetical protein
METCWLCIKQQALTHSLIHSLTVMLFQQCVVRTKLRYLRFSSCFAMFILESLFRSFIMSSLTSWIYKSSQRSCFRLWYDVSIIIRPNDKTYGIVVLNRNDYNNEIYNELKDNDTYTENAYRGCEMLLSFCRISVVSLMYVFKFPTFSDISCSTTFAIFSVAWLLPLIIVLNGCFFL